MSQNIEIEFKNLLTKEEFIKLKSFFKIDDDMFVKQVNHYFDTPTFTLKELGCALRVRQKNNKLEMTLKQPIEKGLLETNQFLSTAEADEMIHNGFIVEGPVRDELNRLKVNPKHIEYFGSLTTARAETDYNDGLIVLDYSYYLNEHDYELEYEVSNYEIGKKNFFELLHSLDIPVKKTENKIRRFYNAKNKKS